MPPPPPRPPRGKDTLHASSDRKQPQPQVNHAAQVPQRGKGIEMMLKKGMNVSIEAHCQMKEGALAVQPHAMADRTPITVQRVVWDSLDETMVQQSDSPFPAGHLCAPSLMTAPLNQLQSYGNSMTQLSAGGAPCLSTFTRVLGPSAEDTNTLDFSSNALFFARHATASTSASELQVSSSKQPAGSHGSSSHVMSAASHWDLLGSCSYVKRQATQTPKEPKKPKLQPTPSVIHRADH